jgi:hypothetical protein
MKKILKPAEQEEVAYYSDFTGKPLGEYGPEAKLIMSFSYGSKYDGSAFTLHLSDTDTEDILNFLASKLTEEARKEIKNNLEQFDARYEDAMDSRAWDECDILHNNREVLKKLLGLEINSR